MPRQITLTLNDNQELLLKNKLHNMGYPLSNQELGSIDAIQTKAKSFVSCAIGKIS